MSGRTHGVLTSSSPASRARRTGRSAPAFAVAVGAFVTVFAAGSTPIALYPTYARDGVTASQFSFVTVAYFLAAIGSLLVLGRLSDHVGRRRMAVTALVVAVAGTLVLCLVHGFLPLLAGRGLQGVAAGLTSSAVGATVVDHAPARPTWLVPMITSAGPNIGLGVGVFGAGILVQTAPLPRVLIYLAAATLLGLLCVALVVTLKPGPRAPGALGSLRPHFTLPEGAARLAPAAAAIFVTTWAVGGYLQTFGPLVSTRELGSDSAVVAAAVFASYLVPTVLGGPLSAGLPASRAQRFGIVLVLLATGGYLLAIDRSSPGLFIGSGVVGGLGMGVATAGSMRVLLAQATPEQRAGLLALVFATSYAGAAVPNLVAGQLARTVTLTTITGGYAGLAAVAAVVVIVTSSSGRHSSSRT